MLENRYDHVASRKLEGAHYTPKILADFVAQNMAKHLCSKETLKIVDPAIGDGELIISLLNALTTHSGSIEIYGFDINSDSLKIAKERINSVFPNSNIMLYNKDFLEVCLEKSNFYQTKSMFSSVDIPEFDLLIANPPYIRTQALGAAQAQILSKHFGLKGRIDIYQAFLVGMRSVLKPTGIAGVITSNRFITTKGGKELRKILLEQYDIKHLWDFGDTKLFEAAVLPAVMLFSPKSSLLKYETNFTSIYEHGKNNSESEPSIALDPIHALNFPGIVGCQNGKAYIVRHGTLGFDNESSDVWRLQEKITEDWLSRVEKNTWATFKDIGKIRVGVKTTADPVFIRANWKEEIGFEPELLKPLTTHHVAERFRRKNIPLKAILYTHYIDNGKRTAINIDPFPLSKKYLESHYKQLSGRDYVIKSGRRWYELWVPQNPQLWEMPKVIFKDISEKPMFWMDLEKTVVNGDCYWMTCDKDNLPNDILWLVIAVANSEFIEKFYDIKFQNKLYSNRRRFITQYVEHFPLPNPSLKNSIRLIALAKKLYAEVSTQEQKKLEQELNRLVWVVFDLSQEEVSG